jgi:hypothetical protein
MNFSEYDNAFSNNEYIELDKKARDINNNKKKNMYKSVDKNNKKFEKEMVRGIEACYSDKSFTFLPINNNYKRQGDFVSGLPTPFDEKSYDTKSNFSSDDKTTLFLPNSESDLSSEYSSLPKKIKKRLRLKTEHLKKYSEDDESSSLDHIKKCDECKQQIINFLKTEGYIFPNNKTDNTIIPAATTTTVPISNIEKEESFLGLSYREIRDIVILIMVGIIIIVLIDLYASRK